ncbi:unnamed protein product [Miscanthus lutarioriparius]|uniref:Germin-like protein n=1 Tax=Miscanthus lutarioriparius TaxID=422564 RepID=A0A811PF49_9POAL|nr:unnamed protein product [Miscanthus lutarioriparius]CAD6238808.1 unnamed protein product [Miscanthus lutarioriparius]
MARIQLYVAAACAVVLALAAPALAGDPDMLQDNPPHTHPRATEIIFVLEGTLEVGFITTANKLFTKTLTMGDVFVFPRGLVHFQQNRGYGPAAVVAGFNSQLQGTQQIAMTLFGATPPVPTDILAKAFQIGNGEVEHIKANFAPK